MPLSSQLQVQSLRAGAVSVSADVHLLSVSWDYSTEQMGRLWQQIILGI